MNFIAINFPFRAVCGLLLLALLVAMVSANKTPSPIWQPVTVEMIGADDLPATFNERWSGRPSRERYLRAESEQQKWEREHAFRLPSER